MKKILLLSAALLLAACSSMRSLPVPADLAVVQPAGTTRWFQIEKLPETGDSGGEASMLAVESSADSLRFVQTNALGAPIARQQLSRNGWQNDGFIAPNAEARRLFAALLPLLATDKAKQIYPISSNPNRRIMPRCFLGKSRKCGGCSNPKGAI